MDPEMQELNAHSELCVNQAYCLNGGICYRLTALGRLYCECANSFEGTRCQLKTVLIPDWDSSKPYENMLLNWDRWLPVVIVVAVAILLMFVLFCIFICGKKCYEKYSRAYPVKTLRYQNASAQTSISQVYLLGVDAQCNGQLSSGKISPSRTRLIACSTTPDNVDNSVHSLNQSNSACLDLESGNLRAADRLKSGPTSTQSSKVLMTSDSTDLRRGESDQRIVFAAAVVAQSTPTRSTFQRPTNCQGASAPCLSPNDSNNNASVNCDKSTTLLSQPGNCVLNSRVYIRDSVTPNSKDVNPIITELYDSDPEATAL